VDLREVLRLFGPAWITMMADIDAASVLTAVANGQIYGYGLVWLLALLTIPLFIIQEAAGRVGVAAGGRGLGELIRARFGPKWSALAALPMFGIDLFSYVIEYTGIAVGAAMLGIPPLIAVSIAYVVALAIIVGRRYAEAEKYLLVPAALMPLAFIIEAALRGYDPSAPLFYASTSPPFLFFIAANIGAVVMPFMLFFQASATAKKYGAGGDVSAKISWSAKETLIGAAFSEAVMIAIEAASAGLDGVDPLSPSSMSSALSRIAGPYSATLFGIGLLSSAFLALVVIALASSWGAVEALGVKDRRIRDLVFAAEQLPGLLIVSTSPSSKLVLLALNLMAASAVALAVPGILIGILISDENIMGPYKYNKTRAAAYWATLAVLIGFGVLGLL
jgi:Mn2+/Fe2+ NRAMP family transporter